jgi:hypothetical protein
MVQKNIEDQKVLFRFILINKQMVLGTTNLLRHDKDITDKDESHNSIDARIPCRYNI